MVSASMAPEPVIAAATPFDVAIRALTTNEVTICFVLPAMATVSLTARALKRASARISVPKRTAASVATARLGLLCVEHDQRFEQARPP